MAENQLYKRSRTLSLPTSNLQAGDEYALYVGGGKYKTFVVNDSLQLTEEAGAEFIECDTVDDLRSLDSRQIWAIQNGYYKGVTLNGYYEKQDTPAPIDYILSDTVESDDGGSVFEVGGIKLEHEFVGEVDIRYFGAKCDAVQDDSEFIQRAVSSSNVPVIIPESTVLWNSEVQFTKNNNYLIGQGDVYVVRTNQEIQSRFLYAEDIEGINISGIKFQGITEGADDPWYHSSNSAIRCIRCKNVRVSGVDVKKMSSGVQLYYGEDAVVEGGFFKENVLTAISGFNHNTKVLNNKFDKNGMIYQTGLTHDIYFINSKDVIIRGNDFYTHIDPASYHVVFKWDNREDTFNYDEAKDAIINNNNFHSSNPSIDIVSQSDVGSSGMTHPVRNVVVSDNNCPQGVIRFVSVTDCVSKNNNCGVLNVRSGINVSGQGVRFKSIGDKIGTLSLASITTTMDADTKNIQIINPTFTGETPIIWDSGYGGQPSAQIINPVMDYVSDVSSMPSAVFSSIRAGRLSIQSDDFIGDLSSKLDVQQTQVTYTPDNRRKRHSYFYYVLVGDDITINNPVESIEGTKISFVIRKTGSPNYLNVNFGSAYNISPKTKNILSSNVSGSILIIEFMYVNSSWHEVSCNSWTGRSETQLDPVFKTVAERAPSIGVLPIDSVIKLSTSGNFTLPSADGNRGRELILINTGSADSTIIAPSGSSIEGGNYVVGAGEYVCLILDGTTWRVLNTNRSATTAVKGLVNQVEASPDTAEQAAGATPTKEEFDALLAELRDLKTKARTAGILAT